MTTTTMILSHQHVFGVSIDSRGMRWISCVTYYHDVEVYCDKTKNKKKDACDGQEDEDDDRRRVHPDDGNNTTTNTAHYVTEEYCDVIDDIINIYTSTTY